MVYLYNNAEKRYTMDVFGPDPVVNKENYDDFKNHNPQSPPRILVFADTGINHATINKLAKNGWSVIVGLFDDPNSEDEYTRNDYMIGLVRSSEAVYISTNELNPLTPLHRAFRSLYYLITTAIEKRKVIITECHNDDLVRNLIKDYETEKMVFEERKGE